MGGIYEIDGVKPIIDASTFIHPDATIIGDVEIGAGCYIGPGASLRGDFGRIVVGAGSNVQDGCTLHSFPERSCTLAPNSHVSHGCVLHGCLVEEYGFVGIGAVVMDGATIGENAMVAAMAFVKAGFEVPPATLVAGIPASVVRELSETERTFKQGGVETYQQLAARSLATLKETQPLRAAEASRPELSVDASRSKALHERKAEKHSD
ncbi:MAG: transferase hexapeptide repeat family protein [Deltaproteobacteria bacterium]|jgi:phenylacetic acid degradation protein|nr:transferase hexapeptide repeat family protein [Deltaproteobacteria bacterium]